MIRRPRRGPQPRKAYLRYMPRQVPRWQQRQEKITALVVGIFLTLAFFAFLFSVAGCSRPSCGGWLAWPDGRSCRVCTSSAPGGGVFTQCKGDGGA